jgi:hypothetical protein
MRRCRGTWVELVDVAGGDEEHVHLATHNVGVSGQLHVGLWGDEEVVCYAGVVVTVEC